MGMINNENNYRGFEIRPNHCSCHPETCCCYRYNVYKGNTQITREDSIERCKKIIDKILEE